MAKKKAPKASEDKKNLVCAKCSKDANRPKLPGGWHRRGDEVVCRDCWDEEYVVRSVTIPVAGIQHFTWIGERNSQPQKADWKDLRPDLKEQFRACTKLSNWAIRELLKLDVVRHDQEKLPRMPKVYLYPEARKICPEIPSGSVVQLLHTVERRYSASRYKVLWRCSQAPSTFRYPAPYPVRSTDWAVREVVDQDGRLEVTLPIGRRKWTLLLAGGAGHRRSLGLLRQVALGELLAGELTLREEPAQHTDHRPRGEGRAPGGGRRVATRLVVKISVWRPRQRAKDLDEARILRVRTGADYLVAWDMEGDTEPQFLYEEQLRRWVMEHDRRLEHTRHDLRSSPKDRRKVIVDSRKDQLRVHHARLKNHVQATAALIRNAAVRRFCGVVEYTDEVRGWVKSYPFHALRERLGHICKESGITLRFVGAEEDDQDEGGGE